MELSVSPVELSLVEPSPVAELFSAAVVLLLFLKKQHLYLITRNTALSWQNRQ